VTPLRKEVTSRDVLNEAVGERIAASDVDNLSPAQLKRANDALEQFFVEWTPPPEKEGELRVSVGEQYLKGRRLLGDLALYAHRVVIRDPLERWLESRPAGGRTATAQDLGLELRALDEIGELIDSEAVLPAPFLGRHRWRQLGVGTDVDGEQDEMVKEASSRPGFAHAAIGDLPVSDEVWPLVVLEEDPKNPDRDLSLVDGLPDRDRDGVLSAAIDSVSFEANNKVERLLHASNARAVFTPLSRNDQAFVDAALPGLIYRPAHPAASIDADIIGTLAEIRVPILDDLSPQNLVAARQGSESFERWRSYLRELIEMTISAGGDDKEKIAFMVNDRLQRVAYEVQEEVSLSQTLRNAARSSTSLVVVNSILWGGAAGALLGADPRESVLSGGLGALSGLLAAPLMRETPSGYRGVLLQLVG
jgi:hypothetical protein